MAKILLFSVTKNDFEMQRFRVGGKGGQKVNKTNSGVRLIHKASGARGEGRDSRFFEQNRKAAFLKLVETKEFKAWHAIETARRLYGEFKVEEIVKMELQPENLRFEVKDDRGRWVVVEPNYPWEEDK